MSDNWKRKNWKLHCSNPIGSKFILSPQDKYHGSRFWVSSKRPSPKHLSVFSVITSGHTLCELFTRMLETLRCRPEVPNVPPLNLLMQKLLVSQGRWEVETFVYIHSVWQEESISFLLAFSFSICLLKKTQNWCPESIAKHLTASACLT